MTKKWILQSAMYIIGICFMAYGVVKTKGFIQILAIAGLVILLLVYSRVRSLRENGK